MMNNHTYTIVKRDGEYKVTLRNAQRIVVATYYTDDKQDAIDTAKDMQRRHDAKTSNAQHN